MLASEEGHTQVLRLLHEKGADRKLTTTVSASESSQLRFFATRRYCCLISPCVVCEQDGRTALSFAAKGAFERAIAAGQDVDRPFKANIIQDVNPSYLELEVTAVGKPIPSCSVCRC